MEKNLEQAKAALAAAEKLFKAGRLSERQLLTARSRVAEFGVYAEKAPAPLSERPTTAVVSTTELSKILEEIRQLRKQQAGLSNELHTLPNFAQEEVAEILQLGSQIEQLWTKYHRLRRGEATTEVKVVDEKPFDATLLQLFAKRKPFAEERSKLRAKLRTPGQKEVSREKWQMRLHIVDGILAEMDEQIRIEKNK